MSYVRNLTRQYGKRPIFLVDIRRGLVHYRYHMGREDIPFEDEVYAGSSIGFDGLTYSGEIRKDDLTLTGFPLSSADTLALMEAGDTETVLTLYRGFKGSDEFLVFYRGIMTAARPRGREVDFVFGSWSIDAARRGNGFVAQRQCPWRVYSPVVNGAGCGAPLGSFLTASQASLFGTTLVVDEAENQPDGYYTGGIIQYSGDSRTIVKHVGVELTLSGSFPALYVALNESPNIATVYIAPGCDKSATTCRDRFNNIEHHLGFINMGDNPFITRVF
jgi:hypothetical protein